jgi:hypothetical protein
MDVCARCQWRFGPWKESDATGTVPAAVQSTSAGVTKARSGEVVEPAWRATPPPQPVRLEPFDRRMVAGSSLAILQVRCLSTAAGCLGIVIGAIVGMMLVAAVTQDPLGALVGLILGGALGMWSGVYIALKAMAR